MDTPARHRPYLDHPRPLAQATTATRAMTAITGDEDQVPLVRPYITDPHIRQERRRAHTVQTEHALALLGLLALAQECEEAQ